MQDRNIENKKGIIAKTLEWAYSKAVVGFSGVDSAYELANSYMNQYTSLDSQVNSLIKWQVAKAATTGFVAGLGGLMIMPLTVPANIASVMYVQIRMITAIAHMGGYDIQSDKVKALVYIALAGNGAKELIKEVSLKGSEKLITHTIQKVSTHLAARGGGASFGKVIPILGGVVGGSIDAISTKLVGNVAKRIFIDKKLQLPEGYGQSE